MRVDAVLSSVYDIIIFRHSLALSENRQVCVHKETKENVNNRFIQHTTLFDLVLSNMVLTNTTNSHRMTWRAGGRILTVMSAATAVLAVMMMMSTMVVAYDVSSSTTTTTTTASVESSVVSSRRHQNIRRSHSHHRRPKRSSRQERQQRILGQSGKGGGGKGSNGGGKGNSGNGKGSSGGGKGSSGGGDGFDGWLDGLYCGCLCTGSDGDGNNGGATTNYDNSGVDCDFEVSSSSSAAASSNGNGNQGNNAADGRDGSYSSSSNNNNAIVVTSSTYSSSAADPYTAFNITTCSTYSHLWTYDLLTSCPNYDGSNSQADCECTFAQELMYRGLLSCSDARQCPSDCPVCSNCLNLICGNSGFVGRIAAGAGGTSFPVAAMALALLCGASLVAIRKMNHKDDEGQLGENLVEMNSYQNWLVPVSGAGMPEERGNSFKPVWLAPQQQQQHDKDDHAKNEDPTDHPRRRPSEFIGRSITLDYDKSQEEIPFPDLLKDANNTPMPLLETVSEPERQHRRQEESADDDSDNDTDIVSSVSGSESDVSSISVSMRTPTTTIPANDIQHEQEEDQDQGENSLRTSHHGRLTAVYRLSPTGRRILEDTVVMTTDEEEGEI